MEYVLDNPLKFILAGNSVFTVQSRVTQKRFTYKVTKVENNAGPRWFAKVLRGPNNDTDYAYMGMLRQTNDRRFVFTMTKASKVKVGDPAIKVLEWSLYTLSVHGGHSDLLVFHEGKCGRCGRTLTVPESIKSGFGPECVTRL